MRVSGGLQVSFFVVLSSLNTLLSKAWFSCLVQRGGGTDERVALRKASEPDSQGGMYCVVTGVRAKEAVARAQLL